MSLWPLPDWPLDDYDDDLLDGDDELGCAECEHFAGGHYPGGCNVCDDTGGECGGYAEP